MTVIDQRLGGTTPLELLIDFPGSEISGEPVVNSVEVFSESEEDLFMDENSVAMTFPRRNVFSSSWTS